jgi:uncharacterized protein YdeI (YjbR/CyaY-like superfamily)
MGALDDAPEVPADDRAQWRTWLEANHATSRGCWLVTWKRGRGPVLEYEAAVEEALCFGWIDSVGGGGDADRRRQYYSPRKPRSGWAATNKARVERLIAEGRMAPAGLAAIERAKANGSWELLDAAESGAVPDDLVAALAASLTATERWDGYAPSTRKMLVAWVTGAKRPETRASRIAQIVEAAERREMPGPWRDRTRG